MDKYGGSDATTADKIKIHLAKLRDEQKIRFSQPFKKVILYDRNSIDEFLEKYVIAPI